MAKSPMKLMLRAWNKELKNPEWGWVTGSTGKPALVILQEPALKPMLISQIRPRQMTAWRKNLLTGRTNP